MENGMERRALIVGLGIGGMSAALALKQAGWTPVIIERAPARRTGGYFIGLQGEGSKAAQALGVLSAIRNRTPRHARFWDVRDDGSRIRLGSVGEARSGAMVLLRGDIEEGLWQDIDNRIAVRFGTVPTAIAQDADGVTATLRAADGTETNERFDLLVGADGLRSTVRRLVFGPDESFLRPLGTMICAYGLSGAIDGFSEQDGIMMARRGRTQCVFPLADHPPTALFTYRTRNVDAEFAQPPAERLRSVFDGMDTDGIVGQALRDFATAKDPLFDSVSIVRMPEWSKNRVVMLGDAAWCLTLYSGMGASAAIKGGLELGQALARHPGDLPLALADYEKRLRPFIRRIQRTTPLRSELLVPSTPARLLLRRLVWRLIGRFRRGGAG